MHPLEEFECAKTRNIARLGASSELRALSQAWFKAVSRYRYSYHFDWFGVPVIQFPQDLVALQEVVWSSRPDCIIETGIAHGGSLLFYASLLKAMDIDGRVVGIDIDVRQHNRERIDRHPLRPIIEIIEGSSVAADTLERVKKVVGLARNPLVVLDSSHAYEHVTRELELYSPLIKAGSYLVVLDTIIDDMPPDFSEGRPWGPGHGPKRAVAEFLKSNKRFVIDENYNNKLLITVAPDGFLKCLTDH